MYQGTAFHQYHTCRYKPRQQRYSQGFTAGSRTDSTVLDILQREVDSLTNRVSILEALASSIPLEDSQSTPELTQNGSF
jgi:hypothetical protein